VVAMCLHRMGPDDFFGGKWAMRIGGCMYSARNAARDRTCRWSKLLSASLTQEQFQRALKRRGLACGLRRGAPSRTGAISPTSGDPP